MLSTLRRDRRTRRQSQFQLETLDNRIVLSAAATGAVADTSAKAAAVEHRQEVKAARHEALVERRDARLEARAEAKAAKQEAKMAFVSARSGVTATALSAANVTASPISGTATTAASAAATTTATPTPIATTGTTTNPTNLVPTYPATTPSTGTGTGTSTGSGNPSSGSLPTNVAAALQSLYQEYENAGGGSSFTPSQPGDNLLQISGTNVGVNLQVGSSSDFNTVLSQLQSDGLQVSTSSATYGLIDGMLPIAELPTVATLASSVTPMSPPILE